MPQLSLNEPAGVLIKTTCVDYPGRLAGSFFLRGCNLNCPYCYNVNLVKNNSTENLSTVNDLFEHLKKRQGILKGIVISGGEPLLNPFTPVIIQKAKEYGYLVKIDTNGTLPQELEKLINDKMLKPDFIAVDIKTTPQKYAEILCNKKSEHYGNKDYFQTLLLKTKSVLNDFPDEQKEYRTVLVPGLVNLEDIEEISNYVPENTSWQFAQFQNKNCLDPTYNDIMPYLEDEIEKIIKEAKKYHTNSHLR